ncbi:MAG: PGPGW domain-containing protein [Candidatus Acidiferrales bacterium]
MIFRTMQQARRFARISFGFALLVLGIVAIPTPMPGFLMVALGLGTLAAEFEWARVLLDRVKEIGLRVRGAWAARREAPGT